MAARRAQSVADAVQSGRVEALVATRDRLARALDEVEDRYAASLAKQLAEVMREIESIKPKEGSAVDEIAKRRAARRGAPKSEGGAGVSKQRGPRSDRAGGKRGTGS